MTKRFWEKVEIPDDPLVTCWKWNGATVSNYASVGIPRTTLLVYGHIFSFFLHHGRWPRDGQSVCHARACTSKECVNPEHLYEGTAHTNAVDYRAVTETT